MIAAAAITGFVSCNNNAAADTAAKDSTASFNMDAVKAAIAESNKTYGECFKNNDSAGFVAHYTSDACIFAPNMPRMCGSPAIGGFFSAGHGMGVRGIVITTEELIGGKDGIAEVGNYDLKDEKGNSLDKGKFIVLWKEENGKWKMHRDEWNSDNMPPPPPPAK